MTALLDLIRFATSNGFWVFAGVAVILAILADAAATVFKTLILTLKR